MIKNKFSKSDKLKEINDEIVNFKKSPLYKFRVENKYLPVIGEGSVSAKIMFVGEAPGKTEAKTGRPFCGSAGKVLDRLVVSVKMKRPDVYITNLIKDRPPLNRDPKPKEILLYGSFLDRQIEIIQPKIIVTLGRYSMAYLMKKFELEEKDEPISNLHGKIFKIKTSYGMIKLAILYHPAVAVYNPHKFRILEKDFKNCLK